MHVEQFCVVLYFSAAFAELSLQPYENSESRFCPRKVLGQRHQDIRAEDVELVALKDSVQEVQAEPLTASWGACDSHCLACASGCRLEGHRVGLDISTWSECL